MKISEEMYVDHSHLLHLVLKWILQEVIKINNNIKC